MRVPGPTYCYLVLETDPQGGEELGVRGFAVRDPAAVTHPTSLVGCGPSPRAGSCEGPVARPGVSASWSSRRHQHPGNRLPCFPQSESPYFSLLTALSA